MFLFGPRFERGFQWINTNLVAAERGFRQKPLTLGGSSKATEFQRLVVMLEGEPFEDINPAQPGDQPACRGLSGGHPSS